MSTASHPFPRAVWIQRLLWGSIPISLITIGLSLVNLAWTSFYTSPAVAFLTLVFDITLLALSAKERKPVAGPSPQGESLLKLPGVCRAGSIACGYFLAMFWLGVFLTSVVWVVVVPPLNNPVGTEGRFPAAYVEIAFIGIHTILFSTLSTFCLLERKAIRNRRSTEPVIPHNPANPVAAQLYAKRIQQLLWASLALCVIILSLSLVMLGESTTFFLSPASVGVSTAFTTMLLVLSAKERNAAKAKAQNTGIPLTQTQSKAISTTELMAEYFVVNGNLPTTSRVLTISLGIFLTTLWLASFILSISLGLAFHTIHARYHNRFPAAYTESTFLGIQVIAMVWLNVMFVKERNNWLGIARATEAGSPGAGNTRIDPS